MKKRLNFIKLILIILLFTSLLSFSACNEENKDKSKSNDVIQLWYNFYFVRNEKELFNSIIENAKDYCETNNIPLEIVGFDEKILSYEDYVFKRNLAAESGNMIIIEHASNLSDLSKSHADYTKLKIYDNILSPYKNRFVIPIGRVLKSSFIDNEILDYYNIDTSENPVITYDDYLGIKQELKKRGAKFELKNEDFYETVRFYLNLNGLLYINSNSDILKDNDKLKESLKKSIFGMCEDIILYDDAKLDDFNKIIKFPSKGLETYDTNSGLYLKKVQNCEFYPSYPYKPSWFEKEAHIDDPSKKTFIIDYFGVNNLIAHKGASLFVYKKITNEKIYDLADYILTQSSYILSYNSIIFAPVIYSKSVLNELKLNENFEYTGAASEEESKVINATYDIFAKDEVKSKEIADAYFSDVVIVRDIEFLVYDAIHEIAEKLSEYSGKNLSLDKFDSKDEEINKLVDKKIDDFIKQLILQIN
jgi:hypothetical protein